MILGEESQLPWTFVAFFFHDRGSTIQKSLVGMLREIVDSTLRQLPELVPYAIARYEQLVKTQRTRVPAWTLESLTAVMNSIFEQRNIRINILLFLDALDEHEGDNEQLAQLLKDWERKSDDYYVNLKICLASRPWNVFGSHYSGGPTFAIHKYTEDDIRIYTKSRLNSCLGGSSAPLSTINFNALTEEITSKAKGVFIWVRLVVDQLAGDIQDGTPYRTLLQRVTQMPEELEDIYHHTLTRIDPKYANETYIMFQLILCSMEPLSLATLERATEYSLHLCLHGSPPDAFDDDIDVLPETRLRWLISRSGGLLEVYVKSVHEESEPDQFVQFLHQTAKDYLQSPRAGCLKERIDPPLAEKGGFYFLTLCCQSYRGWVASIRPHMLQYAKILELRRQDDDRIKLPIGSPNWWIQLQPSELLFGLHKDYWGDEQTPRRSDVDPLEAELFKLIVMVAANLISMVELSRMPDGVLNSLVTENSQNMRICLLQLAIGGPDIVPKDLQDRFGMVRKLLQLGYPPDVPQIPCSSVKFDDWDL